MTEDKKHLEEQFINFIIMMSQSVMLHLGKIANPLSGKVEKSLEGAKATIDLLIMLKEKTKGNLSEREEKFFATTVSTLQMNYVDEIKKEPASKEEKRSPEQSERKEDPSPSQDPSLDSGQDPSQGSGQETGKPNKEDPSAGSGQETGKPNKEDPSAGSGQDEGRS